MLMLIVIISSRFIDSLGTYSDVLFHSNILRFTTRIYLHNHHTTTTIKS